MQGKQFDNNDTVQLYWNRRITMINIDIDARYKYMK